jgi:hypothetical protein
MKKFAPPEAVSIARSYVEMLRQGKFDQIEHDLDSSTQDPHAQDTFAKMAAVFPAEATKSVKVVGANVFYGPEYSRTNITLEYEFPSKWLLANVVTQKKGPVSTIVGFNVTPIRDSLENLNTFTLVGKNAIQYAIFTIAVCSLLFSFYIFVLCARTRAVKLKWLWMLFILVGVGRLAVNWTTGEWAFTLFAVQIPCIAANRPLYGPWTVAAFMPIGAILFLNYRWRSKIAGESAPPQR